VVAAAEFSAHSVHRLSVAEASELEERRISVCHYNNLALINEEILEFFRLTKSDLDLT